MQPDAKRLLQLVRGRRELGLEDEDYRTLLESVTGARSAKGLSVAQLDAVVTAMAAGFKVKAKTPPAGKRLSPPSSARVQAPRCASCGPSGSPCSMMVCCATGLRMRSAAISGA